MAPYLTKTEAVARLTDANDGYGFTTEEAGAITGGDLRAASDMLDSKAPFAGEKTDEAQEREFPRDGETTVPDEVLDWVALRAYQLSVDEEPAVKSEGAGRVSVTYLHGKFSQTEKRMAGLLDKHLLWTGSRA